MGRGKNKGMKPSVAPWRAVPWKGMGTPPLIKPHPVLIFNPNVEFFQAY
jgi:hypothetical protein